MKYGWVWLMWRHFNLLVRRVGFTDKIYKKERRKPSSCFNWRFTVYGTLLASIDDINTRDCSPRQSLKKISVSSQTGDLSVANLRPLFFASAIRCCFDWLPPLTVLTRRLNGCGLVRQFSPRGPFFSRTSSCFLFCFFFHRKYVAIIARDSGGL